MEFFAKSEMREFFFKRMFEFDVIIFLQGNITKLSLIKFFRESSQAFIRAL